MSDTESFSADFEDSNESDIEQESDFEEEPKKKPSKQQKAPVKKAKTASNTKSNKSTSTKVIAPSTNAKSISSVSIQQSMLLQHARACGLSRRSQLPPLHHKE